MLFLATTEDTGDWILGLSIGFVIVVVVVVIVAMLLTTAARIDKQAQEAAGGLEQVRESTEPLWAVDRINSAAVGILEAAKAARKAVTGG